MGICCSSLEECSEKEAKQENCQIELTTFSVPGTKIENGAKRKDRDVRKERGRWSIPSDAIATSLEVNLRAMQGSSKTGREEKSKSFTVGLDDVRNLKWTSRKRPIILYMEARAARAAAEAASREEKEERDHARARLAQDRGPSDLEENSTDEDLAKLNATLEKLENIEESDASEKETENGDSLRGESKMPTSPSLPEIAVADAALESSSSSIDSGEEADMDEEDVEGGEGKDGVDGDIKGGAGDGDEIVVDGGTKSNEKGDDESVDAWDTAPIAKRVWAPRPDIDGNLSPQDIGGLGSSLRSVRPDV